MKGVATCILLLTAVLAAATAPGAAAEAVNTGKAGTRLAGYTLSSDVSKLSALSSTFCQIWGSVLMGDPPKGLSLYYTRGGYADLVASTKGKGKTLYSMLFSGISWKQPSDINDAFNASIATTLRTGDPAALVITTHFHSRGKIMLDFLDSAIDREYGVKDRMHVQKALDGAWVMFNGNRESCLPGNSVSSMSMVSEREGPYNTFVYHEIPFNNLLYARLFGDAQAAAAAGNHTVVKQLVMQIVQLYAEYSLTYARMNAYEADVGYGCELPAIYNRVTTHTLTLWPTAKALLLGLNATADSLNAMETLLNTGTGPGFLNVTAAIKNVISTTNIQLRDLGMPQVTLKAAVATEGPDFDTSNCSYIPPVECPRQPEGSCPSS